MDGWMNDGRKEGMKEGKEWMNEGMKWLTWLCENEWMNEWVSEWMEWNGLDWNEGMSEWRNDWVIDWLNDWMEWKEG